MSKNRICPSINSTRNQDLSCWKNSTSHSKPHAEKQHLPFSAILSKNCTCYLNPPVEKQPWSNVSKALWLSLTDLLNVGWQISDPGVGWQISDPSIFKSRRKGHKCISKIHGTSRQSCVDSQGAYSNKRGQFPSIHPFGKIQLPSFVFKTHTFPNTYKDDDECRQSGREENTG
jgi:hypothetical protein